MLWHDFLRLPGPTPRYHKCSSGNPGDDLPGPGYHKYSSGNPGDGEGP